MSVNGGTRQGKALFAFILKKKKKQFSTTASENPSVPPCVGGLAGEAAREPPYRALLRVAEGKQVCSSPKWGICNLRAGGLRLDEGNHAVSFQRGVVDCAWWGGHGTTATLLSTVPARLRLRVGVQEGELRLPRLPCFLHLSPKCFISQASAAAQCRAGLGKSRSSIHWRWFFKAD